MKFLLDTNVVSALRRKDRLESRALQWLREQFIDELHISALTMMEIEAGIQRLERHDVRQAAMLRAWKDGPLRREFHWSHSRSRNLQTVRGPSCARPAAGDRRAHRGDGNRSQNGFGHPKCRRFPRHADSLVQSVGCGELIPSIVIEI
ncbi:MAG TPA: PIN domain-containing protein [Roseiarcus sp.]|nr:PIN domain-containing protein [Roseiarcus sp.]